MSEALDASMMLVHVWTETTLRHVERVRSAREEYSVLSRDLDREWDDALAARLSIQWRRLWAEEHELIWAAHQLEKWVDRCSLEQGKNAPPRNRALTDMRNALEHLVEADLSEESVAAAGDGQRNRSLRRLPGERIHLATGGRKLFETLELDEIDSYARVHLAAVEAELAGREEADLEAAVDAYIGQLIDERRGR